MAYRRMKRRGRKGRGRSKRRVKRRVSTLQVAKAVTGYRRFHNEELSTYIEANEATTQYECRTEMVFMDRAYMETIIDSTNTQDGAPLGEVARSDLNEFHIANIYQQNHFKNLSLVPGFLTVYEFVAKKRMFYDATYTTTAKYLMSDVVAGIRDDSGAAIVSGTTAKYGDFIVPYTNGDTGVASYAHKLGLGQSRRWADKWKLVKSKTFKLNPGADVFWSIKSKGFKYSLQKLTNGIGGDVADVIPGVTKCLLVKWTGSIGTSDTVAGNVGHMHVRLAVGKTQDARCMVMKRSNHGLVNRVIHATIQNDYQAPGQHDFDNDGGNH